MWVVEVHHHSHPPSSILSASLTTMERSQYFTETFTFKIILKKLSFGKISNNAYQHPR